MVPTERILQQHVQIHLVREERGDYKIGVGSEEIGDSVINSDAEQALTALPNQSVQCIITSPPYYRQRDYLDDSQIGQESTPEQYIDHLVSVFEECRRVLKPDGLLWLNLGDKYSEGRLLGMPWRLSLAMADAGWVLRSDVIWHKCNAMPSSVKNRPTTDHEYVFMFSVQADYYYDADSIREPHITFTEESRMRGGRNHFGKRGGTPEEGKNGGNPNLHNGRWDQAFHPLGRNKRTVWSIPLSKFPEAHFAVFPEKLVEICILASSKRGDCVLDPFCGSGTTLMVARRHGRHFIGIDCNQEYCLMAQKRLNGVQTELPLDDVVSEKIA